MAISNVYEDITDLQNIRLVAADSLAGAAVRYHMNIDNLRESQWSWDNRPDLREGQKLVDLDGKSVIVNDPDYIFQKTDQERLLALELAVF